MQVQLILQRLEQEAQVFIPTRPNESFMRVRLYFVVVVNGQTSPEAHLDLTQPFGSNYATQPFEFGAPVDIDRAFVDYGHLCVEAERYVRQSFHLGSGTGGFHIEMTGNTVVNSVTSTMTIPDNPPSRAW